MAFVHGWRIYSLRTCQTREPAGPVLVGQYNMHLHDRESPRAMCKGRTIGAMWITKASKAKPSGRGLSHDHSPRYDCSCGYYLYRTYEALDADRGTGWDYQPRVVAHITCIGKTILYTEGARTAAYQIDYFLPLSFTSTCDRVQTSPWGWLVPEEGPKAQEGIPAEETLTQIAAKMNVPILDPKDMRGCPICLEVEGWRTKSEIEEASRVSGFQMPKVRIRTVDDDQVTK